MADSADTVFLKAFVTYFYEFVNTQYFLIANKTGKRIS